MTAHLTGRRVRPLLAAAALLAVTGCTPAERAAWAAWFDDDPTAAGEFANRPEVQAALASSPVEKPELVPGDCDSYAALFAAYGLPVETFKAIAWRESGCDHESFVIDSDDAGGGLLGINLKGRLAATYHDWCGATLANITDADVNVRCAAAAYDRLGLQPWR